MKYTKKTFVISLLILSILLTGINAVSKVADVMKRQAVTSNPGNTPTPVVSTPAPPTNTAAPPTQEASTNNPPPITQNTAAPPTQEVSTSNPPPATQVSTSNPPPPSPATQHGCTANARSNYKQSTTNKHGCTDNARIYEQPATATNNASILTVAPAPQDTTASNSPSITQSTDITATQVTANNPTTTPVAQETTASNSPSITQNTATQATQEVTSGNPTTTPATQETTANNLPLTEQKFPNIKNVSINYNYRKYIPSTTQITTTFVTSPTTLDTTTTISSDSITSSTKDRVISSTATPSPPSQTTTTENVCSDDNCQIETSISVTGKTEFNTITPSETTPITTITPTISDSKFRPTTTKYATSVYYSTITRVFPGYTTTIYVTNDGITTSSKKYVPPSTMLEVVLVTAAVAEYDLIATTNGALGGRAKFNWQGEMLVGVIVSLLVIVISFGCSIMV
ncbi:9973_t:CDS:10 [Acaulospora morrowiae]|uniref:9973_t:CDS:1 n=1 Tax=Acaulospora morrowiae TaxID=94023 RepID=A0A9N9G752_9GLOM|nr:9973_t:CDS:10 [Acaulospora morrowiae]